MVTGTLKANTNTIRLSGARPGLDQTCYDMGQGSRHLAAPGETAQHGRVFGPDGFEKPLIKHPEQRCLAEEVGFEPTDGCPSAVFKTAAIDHSATLPFPSRATCRDAGGARALARFT